MVIRFRPGRLGTKPDSLTRRWDVYLKEGISDYASVNPQNFKPIFTSEQLSSSLRATSLIVPVLRGSLIMDIERLHEDIRTSLGQDILATKHLGDTSDPDWKLEPNGLLLFKNKIYVPDVNNL
jgi:hypothetical protein